jgi:hypothetical protein
MTHTRRRVALPTLLAITFGVSLYTSGTQSRPLALICASQAAATTADALAAVFSTHQFVFIGSTHGDVKIDEFLMCLISRPAFHKHITDIVVEWAGSGQQRLIDRYVLALDTIAVDDLAPVFLDTDTPTMWTTLPTVRRFMETLRVVNATLPAEKRVRLIGGNEGVDWTKVRAAEDLAPYPYKTNFIPHLLIEHLARAPGNRTLVVYGDGHIRLTGNNFMGDLEAALGRAAIYVVGRIGALVPDERAYLAAVGDPEGPFFVAAQRFPPISPWPNSLRTTADERSERLADYIDAFVFLGPEPDRSLIGAIPLSATQQRELDRRSAIMSDPQRTMRARYQGRSQWFHTHPDDVPPRPTVKAAGAYESSVNQSKGGRW